MPAKNMVDENIRTYWAAASGGANEYAVLDLGAPCDLYALQVNFAEHNTEIFGRGKELYHRYTVEHSLDGVNWSLLIDQSENLTDNTHAYAQLEEAVECRYLKIRNVQVPGGHFAISGFRAFGKGHGARPGKVAGFSAVRNQADKRSIDLSWEKIENASGYNIRFGTDEKKLYHDYLVYSDTTLTINSLCVTHKYYFTIESFNENGITPSEKIILAE